MATETLILRPDQITWAEGSDPKMPTCYPSDVTRDNVHILLSEEVADDDASYMQLTSVSLGGHVVTFKIPEEYRNTISSIKVCFRAKALADGAQYLISMRLGVFFDDGDDLICFRSMDGVNHFNEQDEPLTTEYATYSNIVPSDFLNILSNTADATHFGVFFNYSDNDGNNKTTPTVQTTQMWLEITHGDGNGSTASEINFKENGSWVSIPCVIYQKQNGSWITTDSSVFENGDRFTIQQLT